MFASRYRAGHEATRPEAVSLMISRFNGQLTRQAAMHRLRRRDRALRLEMESSCLLAMFAEELSAAFPRAMFLLTVREPRAWLNSIMNQHLNVDLSGRPSDELLRRLLYMPPGARYSRGEEELQRLGLFPLSGYLEGWSAHYSWVIDAVPAERLLVVKTEALSNSVEQLAAFMSIPPESIDQKRTHLHPSPCDHGVVGRLSPGLVEDKVGLHCESILARLETLMDEQEGRLSACDPA